MGDQVHIPRNQHKTKAKIERPKKLFRVIFLNDEQTTMQFLIKELSEENGFSRRIDVITV